MISLKISHHHQLGEYLRYAAYYGAVTAVIMSIFELLFHFLGNERGEGVHMLNYLTFFCTVGIGTYRAKSLLNEGYEANDTLIIGLMISATTALFLIPCNILFVIMHVHVEVGALSLPITSGFDFALNAMGNFLIDVSLGFLASIIFVHLFNRN